MPTNFAVFDIFPPNFFIWDIKYSFSKFSLASLNGIDKLSATEKVSFADLERDSLIIFKIFSSSLPGDRIAILSIRLRNSLKLLIYYNS